MALTEEQIKHIAKLAKIELKGDEIQSLSRDMNDIIEFVEQLNQLNTDGVPETSQVTGLENVLRADEDTYTFEKSDMVATMPEVSAEGYLRVHAVFNEDESPSN